MKKIIIFVLLLPSSLFAWNLSDHQQISRLALDPVSKNWSLDKPCEVHTLSSLLVKLSQLRPDLGDPWHFSNYLKINPKTDLEKPDPILALKKQVSPLEILSTYSIDPDDGRDQDLFQRDSHGNPHTLYPDQKWFGALQGGNSQAFRHIEKPPFDWKHPISTFGFPFRAVGEATQRAEIYYQLSLLAFSVDEDYWGWRFLAGSFHYLEDLHQPYHAGQVTPKLLGRGLLAYVTWGWKKYGFMGTMSHLVSNSHRFFESYVSQPILENQKVKAEANHSLEGKKEDPFPSSVKDLALQIRDDSNRVFPQLLSAVGELTDSKLYGPYEFRSDDPDASHPEDFLDRGPAFLSANQKIFEITKNRFQSAGERLRTVTHQVLKQRSQEKSEKILSRLDFLLGK